MRIVHGLRRECSHKESYRSVPGLASRRGSSLRRRQAEDRKAPPPVVGPRPTLGAGHFLKYVRLSSLTCLSVAGGSNPVGQAGKPDVQERCHDA